MLDEALKHLSLSVDQQIALKENLKNNDNDNGLMDSIEEILADASINKIDSCRSKTWVTCFSEIYDSILMWSHYSDCHKGFCIEYDFSKDNELAYLLSPVLYVDKIYDITKHTMNADGFEFSSLLKSYEWKYEKEWRIEQCNLENAIVTSFGVPKPTAIYLGACIEDENKKELEEFAKKNKIQTYKMKLSPTDYKLIAVPL